MSKITKIAKIDNFGIFKNFDWDSNLSYQHKGKTEIYDFKDINIFYGRNYSGKTSLSKIIRALEIKSISSKYENPNFKIELSDGSIISQNNLSTFTHSVHVYNSDFVKENLRFIHDENADIESFSVTLGGNNQQILECIQKLNNELGTNEENSKTGIFLEIQRKENEINNAKADYESKSRELEKLLTDKATKNSDSIKNQYSIFGEINYSIARLKQDITSVQDTTYATLTDDQVTENIAIIDQKQLEKPPEVSTYSLNFSSIVQSTTETLKIVVGGSTKIEELVNNSALNTWVQMGYPLHDNRSTCAFCNNEISTKRSKELADHFDQETQSLRERIAKGIEHLTGLLDSQNFRISFDINHYYQQYHTALFQFKTDLQAALHKQKLSIQNLKTLLEQKDGKLFTKLEAEYPNDHSDEIKVILDQISQIRLQCIQLNSELTAKQKEAKNELRLNHVYQFIQNINYSQLKTDIDTAFQVIEPLKDQLEALNSKRSAIEDQIKSEEDKLKSEGEACNRIKDILNHNFGHQVLSLEPIEVNTTNGKEIKFEIQRNGTKAHNLSEGEQSLISFCYFLAKIQDYLDQDKKPILWIDDPICSLDTNHIYFIYSLLENICLDNKFAQIFISTHNLDFLKYLTQLTPMGKTDQILKRERSFYQIEKTFLGSTIKKMAYHLEQNSSEFIYLFNIIHQCSLANEVNDSNHMYFYNFANNARKFLEIYTYYLFPNPTLKDRQRLQKFWGDRLPRIFSERINHDGSHAVTILEGKITLRDFSEINTNAKLILNKLNECNPEQYKSLLESIGNISVT
ncbi:MAG: AAA family ATPase [Moraxellaceae bacterium]|nr:AAA family ATPase [Moraxellaceae bacterium]MBH2031033.1 AAA family ATPase [Moraxellaceae bacterium]